MILRLITRRLTASNRFQTLSNRRNFSTEEPSHYEKTLNEVTLLGRVGGDPQKRGTESHPVVIFSLATHSNYLNEKGDRHQNTEWHRICVFRPGLRETVYNHLQKGQRIFLQGKLMYGEIKDSAGVTKTTTSIVAEDIIFFQK